MEIELPFEINNSLAPPTAVEAKFLPALDLDHAGLAPGHTGLQAPGGSHEVG